MLKDTYSMRFLASDNGNIKKYYLCRNGADLAYREVLSLWEQDQEFLDFYLSIFRQSGFESYVWETPPVTTDSLIRKFEFVLINNPTAACAPDHDTFMEYFDSQGQHNGVVVFPNLGGDAMLVVPSPSSDSINYSGLSKFYSEAPVDQQRSLWQVVAGEIRSKVSAEKIWVSVAGGGISWLHIRIDTVPKYYRYSSYTERA